MKIIKKIVSTFIVSVALWASNCNANGYVDQLKLMYPQSCVQALYRDLLDLLGNEDYKSEITSEDSGTNEQASKAIFDLASVDKLKQISGVSPEILPFLSREMLNAVRPEENTRPFNSELFNKTINKMMTINVPINAWFAYFKKAVKEGKIEPYPLLERNLLKKVFPIIFKIPLNKNSSNTKNQWEFLDLKEDLEKGVSPAGRSDKATCIKLFNALDETVQNKIKENWNAFFSYAFITINTSRLSEPNEAMGLFSLHVIDEVFYLLRNGGYENLVHKLENVGNTEWTNVDDEIKILVGLVDSYIHYLKFQNPKERYDRAKFLTNIIATLKKCQGNLSQIILAPVVLVSDCDKTQKLLDRYYIDELQDTKDKSDQSNDGIFSNILNQVGKYQLRFAHKVGLVKLPDHNLETLGTWAVYAACIEWYRDLNDNAFSDKNLDTYVQDGWLNYVDAKDSGIDSQDADRAKQMAKNYLNNVGWLDYRKWKPFMYKTQFPKEPNQWATNG